MPAVGTADNEDDVARLSPGAEFREEPGDLVPMWSALRTHPLMVQRKSSVDNFCDLRFQENLLITMVGVDDIEMARASVAVDKTFFQGNLLQIESHL
ncbi:hypothetical protein N7471_013233 [Penicillium samsonianum]|uniref:uncharacterized protein n=1 Tax=Penicillium samsonianum TaxID=1882272 RepID=UPI0025494D92|nr:uncharacterized protein N7471_013233 [Penicillium samsonianum]KAJ6118613.1 hypothetical protein N7471_013233 [Penicillium samsonianum]